NAKSFRGSTTSVDPARSKKYGLGSTTAREMAGLLEEIQTGERLRPPIKQAVLGHLLKNEDQDKVGRYLAQGSVAHKDGSVSNARTDAGILYTPSGPVVVCVLTNDNDDQRWVQDNAGNVICAKVGKEVFDYFKAATPASR